MFFKVLLTTANVKCHHLLLLSNRDYQTPTNFELALYVRSIDAIERLCRRFARYTIEDTHPMLILTAAMPTRMTSDAPPRAAKPRGGRG